MLTVLLLLVPIQKLQLDGAARARVALITGLAVLGYFVLVYLIFFLVYTPIDTDHVRGVQGRYFVIALPVAAVFIAALVNCELPRGVPAAIAIAGSMIAEAQLPRQYCDRIGEMSGRHCQLKRRRRLPSSVMDLVSQYFSLNFPTKRRL